MSKKYKTAEALRARSLKNSTRPCRVPGCPKLRRKSPSPFCGCHSLRVVRFGHPLGRPIDPEEWSYERKLVADFLERHRDHEGVKNTCTWLGRWLETAERNGGVNSEDAPAAREWARMSEQRVAPLAILTTVVAVFLFSRNSPKTLPDDLRLDFAMARAVFRLATQEKRRSVARLRLRGVTVSGPGKAYWHRAPGKVDTRTTGQRLRLTLLPLLVGITDGIDREIEEKRSFLVALHKPFPTTAGEPPKD